MGCPLTFGRTLAPAATDIVHAGRLSSQHSSRCTHAHDADWKYTPLLNMRPHKLHGRVGGSGGRLHLWSGLFMDGNETEMKFHFKRMKSSAFCRKGDARCPFVKAHVFQPLSTVSRRRVSVSASTSAGGNVTQVRLAQCCQDPFRQYQGSQPRPFLFSRRLPPSPADVPSARK